MAGRDASPSDRRVLTARGPRALRGLLAAFVLSLLNLAGVFLALTALGGLAPWTGWQFIGFFGFTESAIALALLIAPNAWRLPVEAAAQRGEEFALAPRRLLLPRWGALAKLAVGLALVAAAATQTGLGAGVILLPLVAAALAASVVALSIATARWGVARPDLDVYQLVVRRPGKTDTALPGISLSAIVVQFLLNITVLPVVKLTPPTILFRPALDTSPGLALVALIVSVGTASLAVLAWRGRVAWDGHLDHRASDDTLDVA